jgi:hypothetical protein
MPNLGGVSDLQTFAVFGCAAAASVAILADTYTTMIGLQHGFVEGNPLMRWLFKKVGISFATFLVGGFVLIFGAFLTSYSVYGTDVYFGIIAAGEGFQAVRNYRKLKAAKISLK